VDRSERRPISRRTFLRGAGAAGAGTAIASTLPGGVAGAALVRFRPVYRRSHEGEQACAACDGHDRHRYYREAMYARRDKPHRGCNCDVIAQQLPAWKWKRFFLRPNGTLRNRWDVRWGR
jgi:TAT (twin-arginine translocation) pathway-exported protein